MSGSDTDADGLNNALEATLGTSPTDADTDDDGLTDGAEVQVHGTDPLLADSDGDTLRDGDELSDGTDPTLADTDGDGVDDDLDLYPLDPLEHDDADGDGIGDHADPDDDHDGADDAIEVLGGSAIADEPVFPLTMDLDACPWSLQGDPSCESFSVALDDAGGVVEPSSGAVGGYEEHLVGGQWTFLLGFPSATSASMRFHGVRVAGPGRICVEGWTEAAGGTYNASTGQWTLYYFPTGEFSGCVQ